MGTLPRAVVVGLVLVLLLFVASLVVTSNGTGGPVKPEDNWVTRLAGGFVKKRPLGPADLQGNCVRGGGFEVDPAVRCSVTIAKTGAAVRIIKIRLDSGIKLRLELVPKDSRALSVQLDLDAGMRTTDKLSIGRDGGQLFLTCTSTPLLPCTAALG